MRIKQVSVNTGERISAFGRSVTIAAVCGAMAVAAPARAQRCVKIEADPRLSTVTVKNGYMMSQATPASFCTLQPGLTYRLSVFRPGFETRHLSFSIPGHDQPAEFSGIWLGMVGRSIVLPGWGQTALGQPSRALETWALLIADGFKVWQTYDDYTGAKSQYDNLKALTQASQTQQQAEERALLTNKLADDTNAYRESLILTAAVGGWVYLHNVVESYLISAAPKATRTEASDFKLSIPKKSAGRAALRSLFFPGLGQRYAGHGGRAILFRTGVFVLALFTVDAKLRYDLAVADRNYLVTQFNNAASVPERESMLPEMVLRQESVETRKDRAIAFAAATGCLWLANVFEAWGSGGGGPEGPDRFETTMTYRNSTLYQEVRLNF